MDGWTVLWRRQDCDSAFQELLATQSPQNHTVFDLQRTSKIIWWHLRNKLLSLGTGRNFILIAVFILIMWGEGQGKCLSLQAIISLTLFLRSKRKL